MDSTIKILKNINKYIKHTEKERNDEYNVRKNLLMKEIKEQKNEIEKISNEYNKKIDIIKKKYKEKIKTSKIATDIFLRDRYDKNINKAKNHIELINKMIVCLYDNDVKCPLCKNKITNLDYHIEIECDNMPKEIRKVLNTSHKRKMSINNPVTENKRMKKDDKKYLTIFLNDKRKISNFKKASQVFNMNGLRANCLLECSVCTEEDYKNIKNAYMHSKK